LGKKPLKKVGKYSFSGEKPRKSMIRRPKDKGFWKKPVLPTQKKKKKQGGEGALKRRGDLWTHENAYMGEVHRKKGQSGGTGGRKRKLRGAANAP